MEIKTNTWCVRVCTVPAAAMLLHDVMSSVWWGASQYSYQLVHKNTLNLVLSCLVQSNGQTSCRRCVHLLEVNQTSVQFLSRSFLHPSSFPPSAITSNTKWRECVPTRILTAVLVTCQRGTHKYNNHQNVSLTMLPYLSVMCISPWSLAVE